MSRTYLTTTFAEKEKVKALGAKFDFDSKRWFVPAGLALERFKPWLPAEAVPAQAASAQRDLAAAGPNLDAPAEATTLPAVQRGIALSELMQGVRRAVEGAFREGVWTRLELVDVSLKGHVYLEVAERGQDGSVLAKARAMIWRQVADKILPRFQQEAGMQLAPGIKLLVRARPTMHPQFGFGLEVDAIDAQYTLGDLEARKREIRARLKTEGLWERNRQLPAPWDFARVLVIAPSQAAGLGDFQAEAQRLQQEGLCDFAYAHSRFQGEGVGPEIVAAATECLQAAVERWGAAPDAIVLIRGGGAVGDLAWLNDYDLARFICEAPAPVFTGIGHQKDSTVLDEVAHRSFDTPSKVIAGIEQVIFGRANEARESWREILAAAQRVSGQAAREVEALFAQAKADARAGHGLARQASQEAMAATARLATQQLRRAQQDVQQDWADVREAAQGHVARARAEVPALLREVQAGARVAVRIAGQQARQELDATVQGAQAASQMRRREVEQAFAEIGRSARQQVQVAAAGAEALIREVVAQGPQRTLERGFVVARTQEGDAVTRAAQLAGGQTLLLQFKDGQARAQVGGGAGDIEIKTGDADAELP